MEMTFSAPCIIGLEGLCANELKYLGIDSAKAENGRVVFTGDFSAMARANLCSRYAERILLVLGEVNVRSFEELFSSAASLPWERYISADGAFPVTGRCVSSVLRSVPDCQRIIKKAVATRLSDKYGVLRESAEQYRIRFLIMNDRATLALDTGGEGLHKRGYRLSSNGAPIKETLAAALAELSRVRPDHLVVDPMCGSGTNLIEAALKALKIAPGLDRTFASEYWSCVPHSVWESERERARSIIKRDCGFRAVGYDIDPEALAVARENAGRAGVGDRIEFRLRDIRDFEFDGDPETVIVNPPYGERLLDLEAAEELYRIMGEKFIKQRGKSYTIICPDDDFEKVFGRKADKRRKLYNGTLKCQAYMYFK